MEKKKKRTSQFKNKTKKLPPRLKKNIFLRVKICEVGKLMFSLKSKKGSSLMVHTSNTGGTGTDWPYSGSCDPTL